MTIERIRQDREEMTIIDGEVYFSRETDLERRKAMEAERTTLLEKLETEKKGETP